MSHFNQHCVNVTLYSALRHQRSALGARVSDAAPKTLDMLEGTAGDEEIHHEVFIFFFETPGVSS